MYDAVACTHVYFIAKEGTSDTKEIALECTVLQWERRELQVSLKLAKHINFVPIYFSSFYSVKWLL